MHGSRLVLSVAGVALAAGACAPATHLEPLPVLQSDAWSPHASDRGTLPDAPLAALLGSPELATLTQRALARNTDVTIAEARVDQARALLRGARQATLPSLSLSAGATRDRKFRDGLADIRDGFAQLDFSLDLDLFGKLRAQSNAALARSHAAELEAQATRLAVEGGVADAYVQRAALAQRLAILDHSIERAVEIERIIRVRVNEGAATKVDLGLQSIQLLNLREERSRLAQSLDQTRTALALLAGEEASLFELAPARLEDLARPDLAPPAPPILLAARPDVGAAEALIDAANGDVKAARASFFPQIGVSLSGLVGNLVDGPLAKSVTLGSSLLAPIFSRGKLESEYALASAVQVETVERYRQIILTALKEAEDARVAIDASAERAKLMTDLVAEAGTTARLANTQYIEGEQDVRYLLDAEQQLNDAEDAQVVAVQEQLAARIALYRAAGGFRGAALAQANAQSPRLAY
jgi:multidrug efflux system outer membrane protein